MSKRELTDEERAEWDVHPDKWPHTPPHDVFRALYEKNGNLWWGAGLAHGQAAYDGALARIDELEEALRSTVLKAWGGR